MSWLITPRYLGAAVSDADAQTYLRAVETADGQALEPAVAVAINNFVLGCKQDGIWTAIKASCILAGARTLAGALVPLVGTAPTNFNFVSGDYNRKTGLVGDGSTKYLNSNRANNADPQDNNHNSVFVSTAASTTAAYMGAAPSTAPSQNGIYRNDGTNALDFRSRSQANAAGSPAQALFLGTARNVSGSFTARFNGGTNTLTAASSAASTDSVLVFARSTSPIGLYSNGRLAFYSIGESLDLARLDSRITTLVNALSAAIP